MNDIYCTFFLPYSQWARTHSKAIIGTFLIWVLPKFSIKTCWINETTRPLLIISPRLKPLGADTCSPLISVGLCSPVVDNSFLSTHAPGEVIHVGVEEPLKRRRRSTPSSPITEPNPVLYYSQSDRSAKKSGFSWTSEFAWVGFLVEIYLLCFRLSLRLLPLCDLTTPLPACLYHLSFIIEQLGIHL